MAITSKSLSVKDGQQVLRAAGNDVNASITVDGFLIGKVGHMIELTIATTNVADDTEIYEFSDDGTLLYTFEIVYTDGTRATMLSAERTV